MTLTIKNKLILLAGAALLGIMVLAGSGQMQMNTVYENANYANVNSVPSILVIGRAINGIDDLRLQTATHILNTDEKKIGEIDAGIRKARDSIEKELKDYEALLSDDKDKKMLADDHAIAADFFAANEQVLALSRANKNEQARDALSKNKPLAEKFTAALDAHMEYNVELAKKAADDAGAAKSNALKISLVVVVVTLLLVSVIGFLVMRSILRPLQQAVDTANRISKGDLTSDISADSKDEIGELLKEFITVQNALKALVADANMLSKAAVEGKLATRADASKHQGDYQAIVKGVNDTLDSVIGPLNVAANYVDRISKGDIPQKITDTYNGDFNILKNNLNQAVDAVNALVADANMLAKAAVEGKLETRADASKHLGDFRKIVAGVNDTLDAVIGPLNVAAGYVDRISKGDIPQKITDTYNGDFNILKNNLNQAIDAVNALVADANMLAKAAVEGKLATRADASKHQGDFRAIVKGVDDTLDAVIGPLNVAANYVDRISKGDTPPKITDTYNGDFNTLKNNLNAAIEAINQQATAAQAIAEGDFSVKVNVRSETDVVAKSLVKVTEVLLSLQTELQRLTVASKEGMLTERGKPDQFKGAYAEVLVGVNQMLDAILLPIGEGNRVLELIRGGNLRENASKSPAREITRR
jgi:methyl-accepting chemotaxis protein